MAGPRDASPVSTDGIGRMLSGSNKSLKKANEAAGRASITSDSSETRKGIRQSIESAIDKLKHGDGPDDGEDHGLSKLVPSRIKSKHRRRRARKEEENHEIDGDAARGRRIAERGVLSDGDSFTTMDDADRSSLITLESEADSTEASIPPLESRSSHVGYLTTTSPLVQATALPLNTRSDEQLDRPPSSLFPGKSAALASSDSTPAIISSLQAPTDQSKRRSPSPVGRIKEALVRRSSDKSQSSPENTVVLGSQEDGPASTDGKRANVASRIGAIFPSRHGSSTNLASDVNPSASSPELSRQHRGPQPSLATNLRPSTPENKGSLAPAIVNTPPTPTEAASSRFPNSRDRAQSNASSTGTIITSPSGNMISHRRARTNSISLGPSKLSTSTSAPLTPTPENSTTNTSTNSGGFFSSVFSAAQSAANTLSTSIVNNPLTQKDQRSRSGTLSSKSVDDVLVESVGDKLGHASDMEEKEPAVKTMGQGDLSLSHLGIADTPTATSTPSSPRLPQDEGRGRSETKDLVSGGIPRAHTYGVISDHIRDGQAEDVLSVVRPRSLYEPSTAGDQASPNGSVFGEPPPVYVGRSGSVRNALSHGSRRKRNSSAATGGTIGAAIAAANTSIANPVGTSGQPKLTGFAVASKKRNRDFHQLFRSVPDDDYLIEDYSCALQREILAHGRLYVSEGHLCFSSNILGWVTTLVMSFDEIVSVEKRSTALLFKNGLEISTLHAKNIFASFTSRDSTYDLIVGIWKLGHPSLRSSLNGVRISDTGGGDRTEKVDGNDATESASESEEESEDGDDVYDEDEDEDDTVSYTQDPDDVPEDSDDGAKGAASRKTSVTADAARNATTADKPKTSPSAPPTDDFPGPATHAPTDCTDRDAHYEKVMADEIIQAPLGKVYNLMFGPASGAFMSKWLTGEQKCFDLAWEDRKALDNEHRTRDYSYVKPLNGAIGPKQTKCLSVESLDVIDLDRSVSVTLTTQTPDVPSGNVFSIKTKYCLSWGDKNSTRLQANCAVEWSGKSWLKGPIEKGANDGQVQYAKDIIAALRAATSSRPRAATSSSATTKPRKKGRKGTSKSSRPATDGASNSVPKPNDSWGPLEPLHNILGPVASIFGPILTGNMVYGLLVGLLVAAWFGWGRGASGVHGDMAYYGTPSRIAAYEEIWRREESELWDWLEERVGMDRLESVGKRSAKSEAAKSIEDKLRDERISEREIEVAIKVTEEKLNALKGAVHKAKDGKRALKENGESSGQKESKVPSSEL